MANHHPSSVLTRLADVQTPQASPCQGSRAGSLPPRIRSPLFTSRRQLRLTQSRPCVTPGRTVTIRHSDERIEYGRERPIDAKSLLGVANQA